MAQTFSQRLARDLKASGKKTALLAVLLVVGLCFWLPPLVGAFSGGSGRGSIATTPPAMAVPGGAKQAGASGDAQPGPENWRDVAALLDDDPLMNAATPKSFRNDPFRQNFDHYPVPILFAEEPPAPKPRESLEPRKVLAGLTLRSTVVGSSRRAAFINGRLYDEGRELIVDGRAFTIIEVQPRRVLLTSDEMTYELTIPARSGISGGSR